MRKRKIIGILGMLLIMVFMITACAKKDNTSYDSSTGNSSPSETKSSDNMEYGEPAVGPTADYTSNGAEQTTVTSGTDGAEKDKLTSTSVITSQNAGVQALDKIIRRFYMNVETQDFDDLITTINAEINRLQGYVESSKISGKRYYYSEELRYGSIVARIPKDRVDEFVGSVDEKANVINKEESSENVTLQYTDIESRKKSLEIEQERLFVLLDKTDSLESIITLESRLSDVRYELQNYETQLRTYDNLVEYSTVTLSIQEVERMTPKAEEKKTVWSRIQTGFGDTMFHVGNGFTNFFVWFVVNLPYLLIWGVIITTIIFIIRKIVKKVDSKANTPASPGPMQNTLPSPGPIPGPGPMQNTPPGSGSQQR